MIDIPNWLEWMSIGKEIVNEKGETFIDKYDNVALQTKNDINGTKFRVVIKKEFQFDIKIVENAIFMLRERIIDEEGLSYLDLWIPMKLAKLRAGQTSNPITEKDLQSANRYAELGEPLWKNMLEEIIND